MDVHGLRRADHAGLRASVRMAEFLVVFGCGIVLDGAGPVARIAPPRQHAGGEHHRSRDGVDDRFRGAGAFSPPADWTGRLHVRPENPGAHARAVALSPLAAAAHSVDCLTSRVRSARIPITDVGELDSLTRDVRGYGAGW